MAIPEAVQKAADVANEIQKSLNEGNTGTQAPNPEDVNTLNPNDAPNLDGNTIEPTPGSTTEDLNLMPGNKPDLAKTPDTIEYWKQQSDLFEHKYKVVDGKLRAEIPALQQQIATQNSNFRIISDENMTLKQQLEQANQQIGQLKVQPTPDESGGGNGKGNGKINPDDYETFGPEVVLLVHQLNNLKESNETLVKNNQEMGNTVTTMKETSVKESEARDLATNKKRVDDFMDLLEGKVQGAKIINNSAHFMAWLGLPDPATTIVRDVTLQTAFNNGFVEQVAVIFNNYKQEFNLMAPAPDTNQNLPDINAASPSPERGVTVDPTPAQVPGKRYTRKEITDFHDTAGLVFKGRDEEMKAIMADMQLALVEGRIIDNY